MPEYVKIPVEILGQGRNAVIQDLEIFYIHPRIIEDFHRINTRPAGSCPPFGNDRTGKLHIRPLSHNRCLNAVSDPQGFTLIEVKADVVFGQVGGDAFLLLPCDRFSTDAFLPANRSVASGPLMQGGLLFYGQD